MLLQDIQAGRSSFVVNTFCSFSLPFGIGNFTESASYQ